MLRPLYVRCTRFSASTQYQEQGNAAACQQFIAPAPSDCISSKKTHLLGQVRILIKVVPWVLVRLCPGQTCRAFSLCWEKMLLPFQKHFVSAAPLLGDCIELLNSCFLQKNLQIDLTNKTSHDHDVQCYSNNRDSKVNKQCHLTVIYCSHPCPCSMLIHSFDVICTGKGRVNNNSNSNNNNNNKVLHIISKDGSKLKQWQG